MSQELIDAANALKAAADKLLELAQKPVTIDFVNMSDEAKEALRLLINPWLEYEYKRRLDATLEAIDEKIEALGENMPDWDECAKARDEAQEATVKIEDYPDARSLDKAIERIESMPDPDDVEEAVNRCQSLPDVDDITTTVEAVKLMPGHEQVNQAVDIALALPDVDKIVTVDMVAKFLDQLIKPTVRVSEAGNADDRPQGN